MTPVIEAPGQVLRGRPAANYSREEMRAFFGEDGKPLPRSTLYHLVETEEIPCTRVRRRIIFPKNKVNPVLKRMGIIPEGSNGPV